MLNLLDDLTMFVFGLIEVGLVIRFILRLFAANPSSSFVNWLYQATQPLLQPFAQIFPTPVLKGGFVIEFTTLFAVFVYAVIAVVVQRVLLVLVDSINKSSKK